MWTPAESDEFLRQLVAEGAPRVNLGSASCGLEATPSRRRCLMARQATARVNCARGQRERG
jgi:hypothetical protein